MYSVHSKKEKNSGDAEGTQFFTVDSKYALENILEACHSWEILWKNYSDENNCVRTWIINKMEVWNLASVNLEQGSNRFLQLLNWDGLTSKIPCIYIWKSETGKL